MWRRGTGDAKWPPKATANSGMRKAIRCQESAPSRRSLRLSASRAMECIQILQCDDAHQPLILDHRDDAEITLRELAECRGQRLLPCRYLKKFVHYGLHIPIPFQAQRLEDALAEKSRPPCRCLEPQGNRPVGNARPYPAHLRVCLPARVSRNR